MSALAGLRDDSRYLQISAPVQPGNSGGPLLDASGHLVGIVSAKLDAVRLARFTGDIPQNVNFALKAELARTFLDSKGIAYQTARSDRQLSPADVGDIARLFTVHIECEQVASRSATNEPMSNPPRAKDSGLTQQQIDWCMNKSPDLRIKGCTAVIQWRLHGGELPDRVELMAFRFRGMAYLEEHDYNRAIADLSEAIRLGPKKEAAMFYFRGRAYSSTGDDNRAIADYSEAIRVNPKDVLAFYWRGELHLNRHDYGSAFSDLLVVAQSGHAPLKMAALAATTIGQMYAGDGLTRDYGQAMHWFRIAADRGNTIAMKEISSLYAMGFGVPRDCGLAERWLEKAAIAGNEALDERAERIIRNCRILSQ